jgi:hypothetical protein
MKRSYIYFNFTLHILRTNQILCLFCRLTELSQRPLLTFCEISVVMTWNISWWKIRYVIFTVKAACKRDCMFWKRQKTSWRFQLLSSFQQQEITDIKITVHNWKREWEMRVADRRIDMTPQNDAFICWINNKHRVQNLDVTDLGSLFQSLFNS